MPRQRIIQYKKPEEGWITYTVAYTTEQVNLFMDALARRYGRQYVTRVQ